MLVVFGRRGGGGIAAEYAQGGGAESRVGGNEVVQYDGGVQGQESVDQYTSTQLVRADRMTYRLSADH